MSLSSIKLYVRKALAMHTLIKRSFVCISLAAAVFISAIADAQTLTGVKSRKIHAAAGTFDLPIVVGIPITGAITVEPRTVGASHDIVFQFDQTITATGTVSAVDETLAAIGTVSATPSGNDVIVSLVGVPNFRRATVSLTNVNGNGVNVSASIGFLVGDVDSSHRIDGVDVSAVKSRSGAVTGASNFSYDLDISGFVSAADVSIVKSRKGGVLVLAGQQALLTVTKSGTGSGTLSGSGLLANMAAGISCLNACVSRSAYFDVNTTVTLTAIPNAGSTFSGWSAGCGTGTFTISVDLTCTATFAPIVHLVTPSAGANGAISPSVPQSINQGSTAVFTVTPNVGYTSSIGGSCGGSLVGNTYTTNSIASACTVTATFTQITNIVTPSSGSNGSITPNTPQSVAFGATRTFTITPNVNYAATVGGTCGGSLVGNTFTTVAITAPCTVSATFALITFTVTPSAGANGSISPGTPVTIAQGSTTSFTVSPTLGYKATVGGTCGGTLVGNIFTTNVISGPCTVSATFTFTTYIVTPSAGTNGSISPNTPQTISNGSTTTFTVTPIAGFTAVVGGTCGGTLVGNTYTTNAITGACTVSATFTGVTFSVTPSAGANGVITPLTVQSVAQGTTKTFTVSPNANYTPSVGGTCGGTLSGLTYTTNPITANCTVAATFVRNSYTVTTSHGNNGFISPGANQTVLNGNTFTYSVFPDVGYAAIVGGTCGGTLTGGTFVTSPITGNCSVSASFVSTAPKYVSTTGNDTTGDGSIGNPWKTIVKGISTLVSGQTLIVKNGIYSGTQNFIAGVPSGISTQYTTIMAETPMQVRIQSLTVLGVSENQLSLSGSYIKVDGFIFDMGGTTNPAFIGEVSGNFNTVSRSIFKRGGDIDGFGGLLNVTGSDNLFEDMAGTGACSICFKQGGNTATTQRNIWRRVVGRFDYSNSTQPKATFGTYGSTTPGNVRDHLYQNVIAIDGQNPGNLGGAEKMGGFYAAQNTANIVLQGSVVLNEGAGGAGMFLRELGSINGTTHSVVWDIRNALAGTIGLVGGNANNLTIGGTVPGAAVDLITPATASLLKPVTNPINLLNNTPGAIVLKQYGTSGTRWGQTGYDQITTVELWPWPFQDIIKNVFREGNNIPAGNSPALNDTFRGFAASGTALYGGAITLTSYIWEYLGTPCPPTACVQYTVTPTAGAGGTISPATPQTVLPGATLSFTVTANAGFTASVGGSCGGTLTGTTYVTNPINGSCTVSGTFTAPGSPVVLYTDILSGPNSGGENNNGIYLSIFGKNFGSSGLGTSTKVFINNVEVTRYISLGASRGRTDIQQITVQIGSLGSPTPGQALPIRVDVSSASSNTDKTFTVNPGNIYFVSLTGNDTTGVPGSIGNPYRTVQRDNTLNNNGVVGCPASSGNQTIAQAGVWGLVQPGDFIVMRGGTWNDISKNNAFLTTQNKAGKVATGAIGTGPITIMGFPGETAFINQPNTAGDGEFGAGIFGADTARQTAYGCGSRITIVNLKVESGRNDGPINTQNGASNLNGQFWRVVNNEMSGISCNNNTYCKGGGVSGAGVGNYWVGNYVHDMGDKIAAPCPGNIGCGTDFENHGFYMEGVGDYEVAYNRIENITGGNGIQTNGTAPTTGGDYQVTNANIHHNFIRNVGKHGINIGNVSSTGIVVHNNVVMNTDVGGIRFSSDSLVGAKVFNNTFYNTDRLGIGNPRAALMNDGTITSSSIEIRNNIFVPGGASRLYESGSIAFFGASANISHNLWFNGGGSFSGTSNATGNPLFISTTPGAENLRLQSTSSPAYCTGTNAVSSIVTNDFDLVGRPKGVCYSMGAYEF